MSAQLAQSINAGAAPEFKAMGGSRGEQKSPREGNESWGAESGRPPPTANLGKFGFGFCEESQWGFFIGSVEQHGLWTVVSRARILWGAAL